MNTLLILIFGFIFGLLISYADLNKFNTIMGLSILKNFTVAKTIFLVIGIGAPLLAFEMGSGDAFFHVKPLFLIGTALGGIIFGIGMSILGYCPGTLPISVGQGSVDALIGILGGLTGSWIFTLLYPDIVKLSGEDLGSGTLFTWMGSSFTTVYYLVAILIGILFIVGAFYLNILDRRLNHLKSHRWVVTGVGLAMLNIFLFYKVVMNKPLGASSSYPYVADILTGTTQNAYFPTTVSSGSWQVKFLLGAFLAGLVWAIMTRTFKITLMHARWLEFKGNNPFKRIVWAFVGGFLLLFGARMADGCTSGHIISGGMQFAASSYVFMVFVFIGFLTTGYFFYTTRKKI
ncbi:MAG: YeeE/YedE thiosulfate transporter family protein [Bacteroidales bacterium]